MELQGVLAQHAERRTADGKAGLIRNGYLPAREPQTGIVFLTDKAPKVRVKTEEHVTFRSTWVPPYVMNRGRWSQPCLCCIWASLAVKIIKALKVLGGPGRSLC